MSNLKNIVPPVELCKQIPAGEFGDTAMAWRRVRGEDVVCAREHWVGVFGMSPVPAPTLEEIITSLLTRGWLVKIDCRIQLDTLIEFYSEKQSKTEFGNTASETALRLWLKVKGIEVE